MSKKMIDVAQAPTVILPTWEPPPAPPQSFAGGANARAAYDPLCLTFLDRGYR